MKNCAREVRSSNSPNSGFLAAALGVFTIATVICSGAATTQGATEPIWPTNGWQTSTPEEQGVDSKELTNLVDFGVTHHLDSLLLVRHGKIVAEVYYAPYSEGILHEVNSTTKAVIGTLIAIAWKDGLLDNPNHPVLDFFDKSKVKDVYDGKVAITVQNLLDMTSGFDWNEGLDGPDISSHAMEYCPNWVDFILDRPMSNSPGEVFYYNSGNAHLLSAIITKLSGMTALEYAQAKLFGPLGIDHVFWRSDPQGISVGGYDLFLEPRDMAKIGYLYLRNGMWEGKQLLPSAWIDKVNHATIDMHSAREPGLRYSNLFWALPDKHVYMSVGYHRQVIMVFPTLDMVAVTTARDNYSFSEFADLVSTSVKSDTAGPTNHASAKLLAEKIFEVSNEKPYKSRPIPSTAALVSGKVYRFEPNGMNLKSLSLILTGPQPHYEIELYPRDASEFEPKVSGPIGLGGVYRKGELTYHGLDDRRFDGSPRVNALRGAWQDNQTFVIDWLALGLGWPLEQWKLTFSGKQLNVLIDFGSDHKVFLTGVTDG
jgi:CubicO group peptidase (beta-lactamase class C family)